MLSRLSQGRQGAVRAPLARQSTAKRGAKARAVEPSTTALEAAARWTGSDEFTHLEDRVPDPPLALPEISSAKRVVLVRHGQSTWNAEGRIQGSTNFAVLSAKGQAQAETTCEMVRHCLSVFATACQVISEQQGRSQHCLQPLVSESTCPRFPVTIRYHTEHAAHMNSAQPAGRCWNHVLGRCARYRVDAAITALF